MHSSTAATCLIFNFFTLGKVTNMTRIQAKVIFHYTTLHCTSFGQCTIYKSSFSDILPDSELLAIAPNDGVTVCSFLSLLLTELQHASAVLSREMPPLDQATALTPGRHLHLES